MAVSECDLLFLSVLVLMIGLQGTHEFAPNAQIVHIDIIQRRYQEIFMCMCLLLPMRKEAVAKDERICGTM